MAPNILFWLSYLYMALLGLIGAIYVSFQIKKFVADRVSEYEEASKWGIISDIIMYPVLLLYAATTFYLSTLS